MKNYIIPKNLLTFDNSKTIKGEKFNYKTAILYLSPHRQNSQGKNICPFASPNCVISCLYTAGRGKFSNVQKARMNKTEYFLQNRIDFMMKIDREIFKLSKKHSNLVVRLNGTSDIPWERIKIENGQTILDIFPNIQFYDYTKNPKRLLNNKHRNYHLTFSLSEEESNKQSANWIFNQGLGNVAIVLHPVLFEDLFRDGLKEVTYNHKGRNFNLFNGDLSDLRFLDSKNSLVCLKAKGEAKKDSSGFVLNDIEQIYQVFK
jgi:hypothetical protein